MMRYSLPLAATAWLVAAAPAFATTTLLCRSTLSPTDGPRLWLTVGTGPTSGIVQARLEQGDRSVTTGQGAGAPAISQAWRDRNSLRLVLVNGETELARLETWRRSGPSYFGTLRYGGQSWRVRCGEEG
jgi:hypothetical protein